jgi:Phage integrase family
VFKRALGKAKLPAFRLYDLRHTFASLLLAASAPIAYVSAELGHVNLSTTLRYYARWIRWTTRAPSRPFVHRPSARRGMPPRHWIARGDAAPDRSPRLRAGRASSAAQPCTSPMKACRSCVVESQDGRSLFAGLRYFAGTTSALFVQYATPCSSVQ